MLMIIFPERALMGMPAPSGAPLRLRYPRRNGYNHVRFQNIKTSHGFSDKVREHRLRDVVVRDNAVFQWPVRNDAFGRPPYHFFRFPAYGENGIFRLA